MGLNIISKQRELIEMCDRYKPFKIEVDGTIQMKCNLCIFGLLLSNTHFILLDILDLSEKKRWKNIALPIKY